MRISKGFPEFNQISASSNSPAAASETSSEPAAPHQLTSFFEQSVSEGFPTSMPSPSSPGTVLDLSNARTQTSYGLTPKRELADRTAGPSAKRQETATSSSSADLRTNKRPPNDSLNNPSKRFETSSLAPNGSSASSSPISLLQSDQSCTIVVHREGFLYADDEVQVWQRLGETLENEKIVHTSLNGYATFEVSIGEARFPEHYFSEVLLPDLLSGKLSYSDLEASVEVYPIGHLHPEDSDPASLKDKVEPLKIPRVILKKFMPTHESWLAPGSTLTVWESPNIFRAAYEFVLLGKLSAPSLYYQVLACLATINPTGPVVAEASKQPPRLSLNREASKMLITELFFAYQHLKILGESRARNALEEELFHLVSDFLSVDNPSDALKKRFRKVIEDLSVLDIDAWHLKDGQLSAWGMQQLSMLSGPKALILERMNFPQGAKLDLSLLPPQLIKFKLSQCDVSEVICSQPNGLICLELDTCKNIQNMDLSGLSHLKQLSLSDISPISRLYLLPLKNSLESLTAAQGSIRGPTMGIEQLVNLKELRIDGIPEMLAADFPLAGTLEKLTLGHFHIKNFHTYLLEPSNLKELTLISGKWRGPGWESSSSILDLSPHTKLEKLSIQDSTGLEEIVGLPDLPNLRRFELTGDCQAMIDGENLLNPNLEELVVEDSDWLDVDFFLISLMTTLKVLDLRLNREEELDIGNLEHLETLRLYADESLILTGLEHLTKLRSLKLGGNANLAQIPLPTFPKLETLSLSGSNLTSLNLTAFPSLKRLDLSRISDLAHLTGISPQIESLTLADLPNLQNPPNIQTFAHLKTRE